jgi:hypothetical protein
MKTKTAFISGFMLVLVCVSAGAWYWYWYQRQVQIEQAELEERKNAPVNKIKDIVRAALKDPDSAIFDDVTYNSKMRAGCGLVNAKNSFGGYTGRKLFLVSVDGKVEFEQPAPEGTMTVEKLSALAEGLAFNEKIMACLGKKETGKS